jgi:integrase
MIPQTLTDLSIRGLMPWGDGRFEVFDAKVPGFAIRVFPSGIKSFVLLYRQKGRLRRLTLGRYPILSLAEARKMAQAALNSVAHGDDPQQEKENARNGFAFDETVETFLRTHCARFNRASTAQETARLLNAQFVNRWGRRDLREITRSEVVAVLDRIVAKGAPSAGNHALSAIRKFFNWCVERGLIEISPCTAIKKPTPHRSRDRVLADHELAAIWRSANSAGYPYGSIVQLLILTAQRRGEVTGMRWRDIDFEKFTWSIPAERTKSNRQQILPLVPAAMRILTSLPKFDGDQVFPAQGESRNAFSGFSKSKRRLDESCGVMDWTVHDLRRTAATGMAKLGVPPHVVERVLNHVSGSLGGVAGIYNRFGYLPEMQAALERWADHVAELAAGPKT